MKKIKMTREMSVFKEKYVFTDDQDIEVFIGHRDVKKFKRNIFLENLNTKEEFRIEEKVFTFHHLYEVYKDDDLLFSVKETKKDKKAYFEIDNLDMHIVGDSSNYKLNNYQYKIFENKEVLAELGAVLGSKLKCNIAVQENTDLNKVFILTTIVSMVLAISIGRPN